MSMLTIDTSTMTNCTYGGQPVEKLILNGTTIWPVVNQIEETLTIEGEDLAAEDASAMTSINFGGFDYLFYDNASGVSIKGSAHSLQEAKASDICTVGFASSTGYITQVFYYEYVSMAIFLQNDILASLPTGCNITGIDLKFEQYTNKTLPGLVLHIQEDYDGDRDYSGIFNEEYVVVRGGSQLIHETGIMHIDFDSPYQFNGNNLGMLLDFTERNDDWSAASRMLPEITLYYNYISDIVPEEPDPTYTITFNANGGSSSTSTMTTNSSGKLGSLPTATRSNYTFDGWYTARSGGSRITTNWVFSKDTTVYAHWTEIYTPPSYDEISGNIDVIFRVVPYDTTSIPDTIGLGFQLYDLEGGTVSCQFLADDSEIRETITEGFEIWLPPVGGLDLLPVDVGQEFENFDYLLNKLAEGNLLLRICSDTPIVISPWLVYHPDYGNYAQYFVNEGYDSAMFAAGSSTVMVEPVEVVGTESILDVSEYGGYYVVYHQEE